LSDFYKIYYADNDQWVKDKKGVLKDLSKKKNTGILSANSCAHSLAIL